MENRQQLDDEWKVIKKKAKKIFDWLATDFEVNPNKHFKKFKDVSISTLDGQTSLWATLWRWYPEKKKSVLHRYRIAVEIIYSKTLGVDSKIEKIPNPGDIQSLWVWALADWPPRSCSCSEPIAIDNQIANDKRVQILTD